MTSTVMVVSRDRTAGALLASNIRAETGLHGAFVANAADARVMSRSGSVDLAMAIIDADLPAGEGHALCVDLLAGRVDLPVMMVSPSHSEADVLRSLEAGAIDHFARPHHQAELLARLRAHLRSGSTSLDMELTVGRFTFHPGQRVLVERRKQTRVWLTAKETRLLRRLHMANGQPVAAKDLLVAAWNTSEASLHTLQTHIYRLRRKLETSGDRPLIHTTARGYLLDL